MFYRALAHTLVAAATAIAVAASGLLDGATVEVGLEHYAERPLWYSPPGWLAMPANTLVNAGYIVVGVAWAARARAAERAGILRAADAYMFYVFAIAAALYGPVQTTRLLARSRPTAALDQWVTLPIFAWVVPWAAHVDGGGGGGGAGERMWTRGCSYASACELRPRARPSGRTSRLALCCGHVVAASPRRARAAIVAANWRGSLARCAAGGPVLLRRVRMLIWAFAYYELAAQPRAVFRARSGGHFLLEGVGDLSCRYILSCEFFWPRWRSGRLRTEKVE
ncbi:PREDICTED: uncharacterized protein LOC106809008 [Priapulus caudatus]|uniref:Uncharacterized protein LOC106809008 n=1 Tax=Priapulus caudatus TaxID=37621 RepID=A0ABM1E5G2_PRICU|nr:PREDICTED: uncharacterized protein LOC106809008 [Priapulus caudatus]